MAGFLQAIGVELAVVELAGQEVIGLITMRLQVPVEVVSHIQFLELRQLMAVVVVVVRGMQRAVQVVPVVVVLAEV